MTWPAAAAWSHRKETCAHPDSWFSRDICARDDWMHTYCTECGQPLDGECGENITEPRKERTMSCVWPGCAAVMAGRASSAADRRFVRSLGWSVAEYAPVYEARCPEHRRKVLRDPT